MAIIGTDAATPHERYCLACRHSLRGLPSRICPECGRDFDPDDPRTTSPHPHSDARVFLAAVSRSLIVACGGLAAITFFLSAIGGVDVLLFWLFAILISPGLLCVLALVAWPAAPLSRRLRILGVAFPVLFLSIVWMHWPLCVTFALHRPFMEKIAATAAAGGTVATPRRVGLFRFHDVRVVGGNVGFQLTGGPGGGTFLVRSVPGSQWIWTNTNWEVRLGGGWYYVYED